MADIKRVGIHRASDNVELAFKTASPWTNPLWTGAPVGDTIVYAMVTDVNNKTYKSANFTVTVAAGDIPAPTNFRTDSIGETSIRWLWDAVTNATQYRLYLNDTLAYTGTSRSPTTSGLTASTLYTGKVQAYVGDKWGPFAETTATTASPPAFMLDGYTGVTVHAAFSVRRLLSSYTGPAMRVQNSAGVQLDIGFTTAGDLNTTALKNHVGTGDGFITTFYNQAPVPEGASPNHQTQTDVTFMPRIMLGGVLDTMPGTTTGSRPAPWYGGTNTRIGASGISVAQPYFAYSVFKLATMKGQNFMDGLGSSTNRLIFAEAGSKWRIYAGGAAAIDHGVANTAPHVMSAYVSGTSSRHHLDSAPISTTYVDPGTAPLQGLRTGAQATGTGAYAHGHVPETIVLKGTLSLAQMNEISDKQKTYFGIT